jgi:DNA polymerase I
LPSVKRTAKTGPSTDVDVLEILAQQHPLPAKIVEYRQYAKLKGTYVDALPELVHPTTGRVHASFNQVVTATGRLSSSDPNLQNIPVRGEAGREIRSAFVPGQEGWSLLAADYSQIELRVLAHYSGDQRLCDAFARDEDIHARVASQVNNVPLEGVTPAMRRQAKVVTFGVIYGQGAVGLARELGIDRETATVFIDNYFQQYPGIEQFLIQSLAECREKGYVKTVLGRRRAIQGVRAGAGRHRNLAERTAVNTIIQGSAADLMKLAMLAVDRRLKREKLAARMLLQIHDELVFEVPTGQIAELAHLVREEMAGAQPLRVPLKVDVKAGPNWADAEPLGVR